MKNFLLKIALFTLILCITILLIEYLLRSTAFGHVYNKRYLDEYASSIEVFALGNSLIWSGIDPNFIPYNAFNAANNGQNYMLSLEILKMYWENLDNLELVIINIDHDILIRPPIPHYNYTIAYGFKSDRLQDYFIFSNLPLQRSVFRIIDYYFLNKRFRHGEQQTLGNHLSDKIANINQVQRECSQENIYRVSEQELNIIYQNIDYLSNIAQLLMTRKIDLLLITTPMHPIRRDWTNPEYFNRVHATVDYLQSIYPNVYYIDFFYDTDFDENDFSDSHHINQFGAEKLSRKISVGN